MIPKRGGQTFRHPIPAVITPAKRRCVTLYIPDQIDYIAQFWGTLSTLIYWWNFERNDAKQGTLVAQVWRDVYTDGRKRFLANECGEKCEDIPPTPKPDPPFNGASGYSEMLGLTIEEMEQIIMSGIMNIRISGGVLQVQYFPCCDWVDIGNIQAIAATAASAPVTSLQEAFQSGALSGLLDQPAMTPAQEGFDNPSTIKCVKATSIKYTLQLFLIDIRDYVDQATTELSIILGGLAAFIFTMAPPLQKLISASFLGNIIKQFGKQQFIDGINDFLGDTAFWDDFVCSVTDDFTSVPTFQGADLAAFYDYMTNATIQGAEVVMSIIAKFSPTDFQASVNQYMGSVGCECDTYLPYGYIPAALGGAISFSELVNSGSPNSSNNWTYIIGLPFEGMQFSPDQGSVINSTSWRTGYTGADTDSGEPNKYSKLTLLLNLPGDTRIDQVKFDAVVNGVVQGAGDVNLAVYGVILNTADVWQSVGNVFHPLASANDLVFDTADLIGTKLALLFQTRNENINLYATISNLRFTGDHGGGGFLDTPLGTQLP